jgi:hypothetical protein
VAVTVNGDLTCVCGTATEFNDLVAHATADPTLSIISQDQATLRVVIRVTVT